MAIERYGDVVQQRTEAYATIAVLREELQAERARAEHAETRLRETRGAMAAGREAFEVGKRVMTKFGSATAFEAAMAGTDNTASSAPGFGSLDAWRRGQLS